MAGTKRNYSVRSASSIDQPWTRARCNRLLRPLTLSLASLSGAKASEPDSKVRKNADTKSGSGRIVQQTNDNTDDAEWLHSNPRKRQRLTYGHRSNRSLIISPGYNRKPKNASCSKPGEIVAMTPLLKGARSNYLCLDPNPEGTYDDDALYMNVADLVPEIYAPRYGKTKSFGAVEVTIRNLLIQTKSLPQESSKIGGAPSLFNLCLRNIPAHIAEEQEWRKEQDPDDKSNYAAEVYEFLESLGCGDLEGWKHLRTVVRAHGESLIQHYIKDDFIHMRSIMKIYIFEGYIEEAKRLLRHWINSRGSFQGPSSLQAASLPLLDALSLVTDATGKPNFQYQVLRELFEYGTLPLAWVVTPAFKPVWFRIILSSSKMDHESAPAVNLLRQILLKAAGIDASETPLEETSTLLELARLPDKPDVEPGRPTHSIEWESALSNTVSSLCTLLGAIFCFQMNEVSVQNLAHSAHRISLVQDISENLGKISAPQKEPEPRKVDANRLVICALELFLALTTAPPQPGLANDKLNLTVETIMKLSDVYESCYEGASSAEVLLSRLFCSIAQCHNRIEATAGFKVFQHFIRKLISYQPPSSTSNGPAQVYFLQKLALETAFSSLGDSWGAEHATFVQEIEERLTNSAVFPKSELAGLDSSKDSGHARSGLRWEEGICEWVAATPASMRQTRQFPHPRNSLSPVAYSDSFNDSSPTVKIDRTFPDRKSRQDPRPEYSKAKPKISRIRFDLDFSEPVSEADEHIGQTEFGELGTGDEKENAGICKLSLRMSTTTEHDQSDVDGDDDDEEEEDELAMPTFGLASNIVDEGNLSLLGARVAGSSEAYPGIRRDIATEAFDFTDLLSDELG